MKKIIPLALVLVLASALVTGCGCRNSKPMNTVPTTMPTTAPTTMPTTRPTVPTVDPTRDTIEDGNGPLPTNATAGADGDTSSATDDTGILGDGSSRIMPDHRGSGGNLPSGPKG